MEEQVSRIYKKGFNNGYTLSQYEPELLKQIMAVKADNNEYLQAIKEGSRQQQKEQLVEQMKRDIGSGRGRGRDVGI